MNSEARNRRTTLAPTPEDAMRLVLPFVFMLFLGTPVLALNANDLRNNLVKIPRFSLVAASRYVVDGLPLGGHVKFENQASRPYQCRSSDKFSGLIWCHEEHTTPDNEVMVLTRFCSLKTEQHITWTHTSNPPFSTQTIFKTK